MAVKDNYIGEIIYKLRSNNNITQKELSKGLLAIRDLSRIETGIKLPGKLMIDAILQRLGKSSDKLESILSYEEYNLLLIRYNIENSLLQGDYDSCRKWYKSYKEYKGFNDNLNNQYILKIQAILNLCCDYGKEENYKILENAINITFPEWQALKIDKYYLCIQELQIICLLGYLMYGMMAKTESVEILEKLLKYIDNQFTDSEEKAKIQPHCMYYLSKIYYLNERYEDAINICNRAMKCLSDFGDISFIVDMQNILMNCYEKLGMMHNFKRSKKYINVINRIFKDIGVDYDTNEYAKILLVNVQSEIFLSNEVIRTLRNVKGISQEELSWEICTQETLSRIECGKRTPNRNNYYKLMSKLGIMKNYFSGYIISDDYELYGLVTKFNKYLSKNKLTEALEIFFKIKDKLNLNIIENKQFVDAGIIILDRLSNKINDINALSELTRVLKYTTMDNYYNIQQIPSREEFIIINQIALILKHANRYQDAIKIYQNLLSKFDASNVSENYHYTSLIVLLANYSAVLEDNNELDKALDISNRCIRLSLKCRRCEMLSGILANRGCIYEKMSEDCKNLCKNYFEYAFYISKLLNRDFETKIIQNHYKQIFNKDICE
ncbi:helix-turn-helix domain-containing protein [Anaerocolumna sp. MB42-C2]|uniref:helix-turn-helix domain-containing protein n=1 Tax=Anaerocolumna sp. MB42-C2 TaxID=3070997 RepID=UPI0027E09E6D|nr:helix-turn-helix domain-containing protein [Anaerocolumna sp. MB42-C2]WMJ87605.1 hypothetical protein RBU59_26830 [Anaerocolumna sp. MB42-C2]